MKHALTATLITLLLCTAMAMSAEPVTPYKLVYTRQPRHETPIPPLDDASNWQVSPDTGDMLKSNETDLVLDDMQGKQFVAHACTTVPEICAAQEARVSPNRKRIIYSVLKSDRLNLVKTWGGPWTTDLFQMQAQTSELWVLNLNTLQKRRLTTGEMDRTADWLDNQTIVFSSGRSKKHPPSACHGNDYRSHPALQIHRARIASTGIDSVVNLTPHESLAVNPLATTDGDILYTSWQGMCPRRPGTPQNEWWLARMDSNGGQGSGIGYYFSHTHNATNSPYIKTSQWLGDWTPKTDQVHRLLSLRAVAELRKGYYALVSYYRGNSTGAMGLIVAFTKPLAEGIGKLSNFAHRYPPTIEGPARFIPGDLVAITPYATATDASDVVKAKDGRAAGRAGYPAPWPLGWLGLGPESFLFTGGRGWCYFAIPIEKANRKYMGGEPPCKKDIRIAKKAMVENPFDKSQSEVIACPEEKWNCQDARAIAEYKDFFGQELPAKQPAYPLGKSRLQVVNSFLTEFAGTDSATSTFPAGFDKFCVDLVSLSDKPAGQGLTGYTPLNTLCAKPETDGSLAMDVPSGVPFFHYAVDKDGKRIAESLVLDSLRKHEKRTCTGCHFGHSEEVAKTLPPAAEAFGKTIAGQK